MNKKILIGCILLVFILAMISLGSATSNVKYDCKKVSPLYKMRFENAIEKEEKTTRVSNFLIKITKNRVFFLPFQLLKNQNDEADNNVRQQFLKWTVDSPTCYGWNHPGCWPTHNHLCL